MASNSSSIIFAGGSPTGLNFVGGFDASLGVFPSGASQGSLYKVTVGGTVNGRVFAVYDGGGTYQGQATEVQYGTGSTSYNGVRLSLP